MKTVKDKKGNVHVYLTASGRGVAHTILRGAPVRKVSRDMEPGAMARLRKLMNEFLLEEEGEAEHQADAKSCDCNK